MKGILTIINDNLLLILSIIVSLLAIIEKIKKPFKNGLKNMMREATGYIQEDVIMLSKENSRLNDNCDKIIDRLDMIETKTDMIDIANVRNRIVTFENLIRIQKKEIKYHQYKAIFEDIKKWKDYHEKYPNLNGMLNIAIEMIEDSYKVANFSEDLTNHK